jgi:hypothetical protein
MTEMTFDSYTIVLAIECALSLATVIVLWISPLYERLFKKSKPKTKVAQFYFSGLIHAIRTHDAEIIGRVFQIEFFNKEKESNTHFVLVLKSGHMLAIAERSVMLVSYDTYLATLTENCHAYAEIGMEMFSSLFHETCIDLAENIVQAKKIRN